MAAARPIYFERQYVSAEDLNALFDYDIAGWREHNRSWHGCGVVCGLAVRLEEGDKTVRVTPGYAVGPLGDEILVAEEQVVAVDCANLANHCEDCNPAASESAVYIAIRYVAEPSCPRPIAPERCATRDDCLPVRVRDSFEIRCRSEKPQNCGRRMDFEGCSAHALLLGLSEQRETALSPLFGCPPDSQEEWLILATITPHPVESGRLLLSYANRSYLPSTQYLLDLLRVLGPQALKKQALRVAITRIDGITSGVLRLNRGRILRGLLVGGRGFRGAQAVRFEPPAPDTAPDIAAQIVPGSITDESLQVDLHIPVRTPIRRLSLVVELENGLRISSGAQQTPIFIDLIDNPVDGIPAMRNIPFRDRLINLLRARGMTTAQSVVIAGVPEVAHLLSFGIGIPRPLAFQRAQLIVRSAQQWLAAGAP